MKYSYVLILMTVLFSNTLFAQEHSTHNFEIKGGFLYDADDYFKTLPESTFWDWSNNTYLGFNYLALGYTKFKDKRRSGVELDFFKFEINPTPEQGTINGNLVDLPDINRAKIQMQAAYFIGKSIFETNRFDLFIAPVGSFTFRREQHIPTSSSGFPFTETDFVLGLGGKFQGKLNITDNIGIVFGAKMMLLDYMLRIELTENPNLLLRQQRKQTGNFDLLRNDAVFQLGISFGL